MDDDLCEQARVLTARSWARTHALQQQLYCARQRLADSRKLLARSAAASTLPYHRAAAPAAEPREPQAGSGGTQRTFAAVAELIEQIESAATRDADLTERLIDDIKFAIQTNFDPYLLMGILLEGIADTVLKRLPEKDRRDTAVALCALLWERINQGAAE